MNAPPTIRQLQYLNALAHTRNFHRAADLCAVSQSTLSAGIKEMENLLGVPILDRQNKKNLILTPFGLEVLSLAREILPAIEKLTLRAKSLSEPLSGIIRLGIIPTIAPYILPDILPKLQKEFPKIEFQLIEDLTSTLIHKMNQGAIDFSLIAFPYSIEGFNHKILFEEEFFCATKKDHFKNIKYIDQKTLKDQNILLLDDGHCLRDHALSACKLENFDKKSKILSATSLLTIIQMVSQGHGITLLPEMVIRKGFLTKNLSIYPFKTPTPKRQIGTVWHKKNINQDTINQIIEYLEHCFAAKI